MPRRQQRRFSGPVTVFRERRLPEEAKPAGYAALIDAYDLSVPLPLTLSAIGRRHRVVTRDGRRVRELAGLADAEAQRVEEIYAETFGGRMQGGVIGGI